MFLIFMSDLQFKIIKSLDIGYINSLYFIMGFIGAKFTDNIYGKYDEEENKKKSNTFLLLDICVHFSIISIFIFFARSIIEKIPSPVDKIGNFEHKKMKELTGANNLVIGFTIMFFQDNLKKKIQLLFDRT